ncbi:MAG: hypothetical protein NTX82_04270 [Candidatus Parcubacteria bacterium]|nr:hypothetical protein [Candidatus Parcubacteria bacterium]
MRNFTLILFSFFIVILLVSFNYTEPMYGFIAIFLAFVLTLICLFAYLGFLRGMVATLAFLLLPFIFEYLLFTYNSLQLPFFKTTIFTSLTKADLAHTLTLKNLIIIFLIPIFLTCCLIFAQKIRLYSLIKKYYGTFIVITASLLFAINFVVISPGEFSYNEAIKWLAISLVINLIMVKLYKFNFKANDIYKELPIIIFLLLYGFNLMHNNNSYSILIGICLAIFYLIMLLNEHKLRKLNPQP